MWENYTKMYLRETGLCGKDWIDLAQDRDQWRAIVNTVMNLRVAECLAASQEGLSSMELVIFGGESS
jgi:hypothetical protein